MSETTSTHGETRDKNDGTSTAPTEKQSDGDAHAACPSTAPTLYTTKRGYEKFSSPDGVVQHARLLAVAEFDEIPDSTVVLRENGIPWDLRPDNLRLVTRRYTRGELVAWIEAFVAEFGVAPGYKDVRTWPGPSVAPYMREFGSFSNAVKAAGYAPRGDGGVDG